MGIVGTVVEMIRGNAVVAFDVDGNPRDLLMALLEINIKKRQKWVVNCAALQKVFFVTIFLFIIAKNGNRLKISITA